MSSSIFKNIILKVKKKQIKNIENLDVFIKVLACGIWADGVIKKEELVEIREIIKKALKDQKSEEAIEIVEDLVIQQVELYAKENWLFLQDLDEVLSYILKNRIWDYAEYLMQIFQADKVISSEEGDIAKHLKNLIESKKFFEKKLGIEL